MALSRQKRITTQQFSPKHTFFSQIARKFLHQCQWKIRAWFSIQIFPHKMRNFPQNCTIFHCTNAKSEVLPFCNSITSHHSRLISSNHVERFLTVFTWFFASFSHFLHIFHNFCLASSVFIHKFFSKGHKIAETHNETRQEEESPNVCGIGRHAGN